MKVVLDSNVLFAYFSSLGLCHDLGRFVYERHEVCLRRSILNEVRDALRRKTKSSNREQQEFMTALIVGAFVLEPAVVSPDVCRYPKDIHVLGLALAAQADMIVTGDQDLQFLKKFKGIPILSPREAWIRLRNGV